MNDVKPRSRGPKLFAVVLIVVVAVLVILARKRFQRGEPKMAGATAGAFSSEIMGTGTIESVTEANLAFEIQGRIAWLGVDEGEAVKAGQVLARLDDSREGRVLAVAEAGHEAAIAAVEGAAADVTKIVATRDRWKAEFGRAERLYKAGAISLSDYEQAVERYKTAEAGVRGIEAARGQASKNVTTASRAVNLERTKVNETVLRCPFDGVIVRRMHEVGDVPSAGEPILSVISLKKIWARAWVDETALAELEEGQAARIELRSNPGRYLRGRIDRIGKQVDRQTHELVVDVELLERPNRLAVGARADVWMPRATATNAAAPGVPGREGVAMTH